MPPHVSDRFLQDATGTWWYYWESKGRVTRTRCVINVCEACGAEFPIASMHKDVKFCSKECRPARGANLQKRGAESHLWRGGKTTRHGYVMVYMPTHPSCAGTTRKYVAEHRLVMEAALGRPLLSSEYVHHRNGEKTDNRPENLEIIGATEHAKRHWESRLASPPHCPTCTCGH